MNKPGLYVLAYDLHYPKVHWPTWNAMLDFLKRNKVQGFIFGGDQFDNEAISHHTRGKPLYRERAAYKRDEEGFKKSILAPLLDILGNICPRVWIVGNHDRFEHDLIEEHPELEGVFERVDSLRLADNGWQVVPLGHSFRLGKLMVIHGEFLTGIGNQAGTYPARKAVELYASNVVAGHTHAPQSFTKVSPVEHVQKWMAWISPVLCTTNPSYLQGRPTAWVNGFTVVELMKSGDFNLFPIIVTNGKFSFGGKIYGK